MKIFKIATIIKLVILFFLYPICARAQCEISTLKARIQDQIALDLAMQDSSMVIDNLTAGINIKKNRGDKYCDTIEYLLSNRIKLRFYLTGSNINQNDASLKLVKINREDMPIKIIKEIKSGEQPSQVTSFDYIPDSIVKCFLILSLKNHSKGCVFATVTQYCKSDN